ncbi:MAG: peptidoglycan editing factor PgeF [Gammaproteobacteria bacterium]
MNGVDSIPGFVAADWPAPVGVHGLCTTRRGGTSQAPFDSLNLGDHMGDDPQAVARNRLAVERALKLPRTPVWLQQVHGVRAVDAGTPESALAETPICADASVAHRPGAVCVVMTADCLPVLFCDRAGHHVGAAHAGWRGLAAGVLERTVAAMGVPAADLLAWMGPAIGPDAFEVGDEVRAEFIRTDPQAAEAFRPGAQAGKWMADLYTLARQRLQRAGVEAVSGGGFCTFSDERRFFSYRRDGTTGRMASLAWIDAGN